MLTSSKAVFAYLRDWGLTAGSLSNTFPLMGVGFVKLIRVDKESMRKPMRIEVWLRSVLGEADGISPARVLRSTGVIPMSAGSILVKSHCPLVRFASAHAEVLVPLMPPF